MIAKYFTISNHLRIIDRKLVSKFVMVSKITITEIIHIQIIKIKAKQ